MNRHKTTQGSRWIIVDEWLEATEQPKMFLVGMRKTVQKSSSAWGAHPFFVSFGLLFCVAWRLKGTQIMSFEWVHSMISERGLSELDLNNNKKKTS